MKFGFGGISYLELWHIWNSGNHRIDDSDTKTVSLTMFLSDCNALFSKVNTRYSDHSRLAWKDVRKGVARFNC